MNTKSNFAKGLKTLFFLSVVAALSTFGFTACNQHPDKMNETAIDSTATQPIVTVDTAQMRADWDKFKNDAREEIKKSDDSIVAFKKKAEKVKGKMKEKYDREVTLLERRNDTLKVRLDTYKDEGKEKWEDFETHFNHDMNEVKQWLKDSTIIER
jgi:hypothetical protein